MDSSGRLILMAVHAHPDDETISMGGTLATYAAAHSATTDTYVITGKPAWAKSLQRWRRSE